MHIAEGVLSGPVLAITAVGAAIGIGMGLRRLDDDDMPRVAVMASAFFIASLIHVPIGPSSAHLILGGLAGLVLGWAAFPALLVALLLQAVLFGFGGLTTLGANTLIMALPAVGCHRLYSRPIGRSNDPRRMFALGFAAGATAILLGCIQLGASLVATGKHFAVVAELVVFAYIPMMVIEGFVTGAAVVLLRQVRPQALAAVS